MASHTSLTVVLCSIRALVSRGSFSHHNRQKNSRCLSTKSSRGAGKNAPGGRRVSFSNKRVGSLQKEGDLVWGHQTHATTLCVWSEARGPSARGAVNTNARIPKTCEPIFSKTSKKYGARTHRQSREGGEAPHDDGGVRSSCVSLVRFSFGLWRDGRLLHVRLSGREERERRRGSGACVVCLTDRRSGSSPVKSQQQKGKIR